MHAVIFNPFSCLCILWPEETFVQAQALQQRSGVPACLWVALYSQWRAAGSHCPQAGYAALDTQVEGKGFVSIFLLCLGFPAGSDSKESASSPGLIPGLGRSPGEDNGYPLLYSCLENPMMSYSPWGCKESDMAEWRTLALFPFGLHFEFQSVKVSVSDMLIPPLIKLNRTYDPDHGEEKERCLRDIFKAGRHSALPPMVVTESWRNSKHSESGEEEQALKGDPAKPPAQWLQTQRPLWAGQPRWLVTQMCTTQLWKHSREHWGLWQTGKPTLFMVFKNSGLAKSKTKYLEVIFVWASQVALVVKSPPANAGDAGSIPGWGRPPGRGYGNPLHYSCLENPMDRGAWQTTVQGVAKSQTQLKCLSMHTCIFVYRILMWI